MKRILLTMLSVLVLLPFVFCACTPSSGDEKSTAPGTDFSSDTETESNETQTKINQNIFNFFSKTY